MIGSDSPVVVGLDALCAFHDPGTLPLRAGLGALLSDATGFHLACQALDLSADAPRAPFDDTAGG